MLVAENVRAGDLIAARFPAGSHWPPLIERAWSANAAILPLDPRLSPAERDAVLRRARPTIVLGDDGTIRLDDGVPVSSDIALVMHTSGTAGVPKLVELEHAAVRGAVATSSAVLGASAHDAWVCCLPAAHIGGMLVLLRAVLLGAPLVVHERFDAAEVARRPGSFVSLVPTMLSRLLDVGADLSSYRTILIGGAALGPELRARAEQAGASVVETYGLTESCGGVVYDGRPFPDTEVRIDDDEVLLRGPTIMRGYRGDPVATSTVLAPDGWLRTGDGGSVDDDGRLRVGGRLADVITSGGEKVWPQEVEAALASHANVSQVAVAPRPDPEWGERVVAFVVPTDASAPPTLDELREHASASIARFKAPRELVLVEDLPRTASGKLRRAAAGGTGE